MPCAMSNVNAPFATRRYFDITDQVRQPHVINNKLIGAQSAETSSKEDGTIVGGGFCLRRSKKSSFCAMRKLTIPTCPGDKLCRNLTRSTFAPVWPATEPLLSPIYATEWSLHILLGVKTYLCPNIRSSTVKSMASTRCL